MSTGLLRQLVVNVVANAQPAIKGLDQLRAGVGGFALKVGALAAGVFSISEAFQGAAENDKAVARLNAVVEATGHAAGFSSQQIQQMASDLQQTTTFADEVTIGAAAMLAGFQNIKGDVFQDAMIAAQDMATVMQQSLPSAIALVGKALDSPATGLTALTRVGFVFSDQQKKMIKDMVAANDTIGAQKILLDELNSAFGGAAAAEAKTFSGQLQQMKTAIGDVGEALASQFQPHLIEAVQWVKELATSISEGDIPAHVEGWLRFGAALGAVVFVAPKVHAAINGIQKSLVALNKTVTISNVIGQAFSGPKGWLTLLIGAGAAAGAIYAVDSLVDIMESSASATTTSTEALKQNVSVVKASAEATAKAAEAEEKLLDKLKEQVATYGMSARQAELYKAQQEGVSQAALKEARAMTAVLEARDASKKALDELIKKQEEQYQKAQSMRDSFRTPAEEHAEKIREINELIQAGALSWADYGAAVADANKKLVKQNEIKAKESPAALELGSAEAYQKIAESKGIQRSQQIAEKQLQEAQAQTRLLTEIASGNERGGSSIAVVNF